MIKKFLNAIKTDNDCKSWTLLFTIFFFFSVFLFAKFKLEEFYINNSSEKTVVELHVEKTMLEILPSKSDRTPSIMTLTIISKEGRYMFYYKEGSFLNYKNLHLINDYWLCDSEIFSYSKCFKRHENSLPIK